MSNELELELEIQARGLNAPRLTPTHIQNCVVSELYHVFPGTCTTVCCLVLYNGFTVVGESCCVSPENFDSEIGNKVAKGNAIEKIWMLEGYLLKNKLLDR